MVTLGQVLRRLLESTDDSALLDLGLDVVMLARIQKAAERLGESPTAYAFAACRGLIEQASEEEWTTLTGHMQNSAVPGDEIIVAALRRAMQRDGF